MNPKRVAIVAMGSSHVAWTYHLTACGHKSAIPVDEVWAINAMAATINHDRAFVSDDIKRVLEPMVARNPGCMVTGLLKHLKETTATVYTAEAYDDYPTTVGYPLAEVLQKTGMPYLNSSVAYAVAYALSIGVKSLHLYGCDFTYPDRHQAESGRGCVEFLLGIAHAMGVEITMPDNTTLMDSNVPPEHRFYGYARKVKVTRGPNVSIEFEDEEPQNPAPPLPAPNPAQNGHAERTPETAAAAN